MNPTRTHVKTVAVLLCFALSFFLAGEGWAKKHKPKPKPKSKANHKQVAPAVTKIPERKDIRIGICLPLTGNGAQSGKRQRDAIVIAHKIQPQAAQKEVVLVYQDTASTLSGVRSAAQILIATEDVDCIIGGWSMDEAVAILDVAEKTRPKNSRRIPVFITTANGVLNSEIGFFWRMASTLTDQARVGAQFAVKKLKTVRAGIIIKMNDRGGITLASAFSSKMIELGGSVEIAYVNKMEEDLDAQFALLNKKKVDIVFLPYTDQAYRIIAYARSHGFKIPILVTNVFDEHAFGKALGPAKDVYIVTGYNPDITKNVRSVQFTEEFHKLFGDVDSNAALAADAYFVYTDTLNEAGGKKKRAFEARAVAAALRKNAYISGDIMLDQNAEIARNLAVSVVQGSRLKYVDVLKP